MLINPYTGSLIIFLLLVLYATQKTLNPQKYEFVFNKIYATFEINGVFK